MSADVTSVPILLSNGTVHRVSLRGVTNVGQAIASIVESDTVRESILDGLEDVGWDLQTIRIESRGRIWEEEELEALGDGASEP